MKNCNFRIVSVMMIMGSVLLLSISSSEGSSSSSYESPLVQVYAEYRTRSLEQTLQNTLTETENVSRQITDMNAETIRGIEEIQRFLEMKLQEANKVTTDRLHYIHFQQKWLREHRNIISRLTFQDGVNDVEDHCEMMCREHEGFAMHCEECRFDIRETRRSIRKERRALAEYYRNLHKAQNTWPWSWVS
jgi:hypothetical protein